MPCGLTETTAALLRPRPRHRKRTLQPRASQCRSHKRKSPHSTTLKGLRPKSRDVSQGADQCRGPESPGKAGELRARQGRRENRGEAALRPQNPRQNRTTKFKSPLQRQPPGSENCPMPMSHVNTATPKCLTTTSYSSKQVA